jgi:hypothetical protein
LNWKTPLTRCGLRDSAKQRGRARRGGLGVCIRVEPNNALSPNLGHYCLYDILWSE